MELVHQGGAELEGRLPAHQDRDAPLDLRQDAAHARRLLVLFTGVFDVHCHVVRQTLFQHGGKPVGEGPVRIQLDRVAEGADLPQKLGQIGVEQGLAARDRHPVQKPLALAQKRKKIVLAQLRNLWADHQAAVVAEGAAEITADGEDRAGHAPRKIQERHLLQTAQLHRQASCG